MRVIKTLTLLALCMTGSLAMAQDMNCNDLKTPQARQECAKHKGAANVDCSSISDPQARKECAGRKQQNTADCSKIANTEARQQCIKQKVN